MLRLYSLNETHADDYKLSSEGITFPATIYCFICSSNVICPGPACLIQYTCETVMRPNYLSPADDTDSACIEAYLLGLLSQAFLSRNGA